MKSPAFLYSRPNSLEEAFSLLDRYAEDAKLLAGGQSLMPLLNMRLASPQVIIDMSQLNFLKEIQNDDSQKILQIGAMVRHSQVESSALVRAYAPLLSMSVGHVAHRAIRARGTFGGSIAMADSAAEMPAMTLAQSGVIKIGSSTGTRLVAANDFFQGLYATDLKPNEILLGINFPHPLANQRYVFEEISRRAGDYATVGIGMHGSFQGNVCQALQIVFFAVADRPRLLNRVTESLVGQVLRPPLIDQALHLLEEDITVLADLYHDVPTKLHLMKHLLKKSLLKITGEYADE